MATLTGITAKRAQEIWDSSVVSGQVNDAGQLLLTTRGGTVLNGGSVINPYLQKTYPVGSVYMNENSTNPGTSTMLNFGTWVAYGQGKVPVGVDPGDVDFNAANKIGGAKRVTLTAEESGLRDHGHGASIGSSSVPVGYGIGAASTDPAGDAAMARGGRSATKVLSDSLHSHSISISGSGAYGANNAHENMSPYITVYMWKRTA